MRPRLRHAPAVAVVAALAACGGGAGMPPPPMPGPTAAELCLERRTGPETWEVGCAGPAVPVGAALRNEPGAQAALLELVLRRGALVAQREGFPAFRLGATRVDAVTVVRQDYGDPSWGPGGPPHWGPISQAEHWRDYRHLATQVATTVPRLTAELSLVAKPAPGDHVASDILAAPAREAAR